MIKSLNASPIVIESLAFVQDEALLRFASGLCVLNTDTRHLEVAGEAIRLTPNQYKITALLARNLDSWVATEETARILEYKPPFDDDISNSLKVQFSQLRYRFNQAYPLLGNPKWGVIKTGYRKGKFLLSTWPELDLSTEQR